MHPLSDNALTLARTRRHFFRDCGVGLGTVALSALLNKGEAAELFLREAADCGLCPPITPRWAES